MSRELKFFGSFFQKRTSLSCFPSVIWAHALKLVVMVMPPAPLLAVAGVFAPG
jgi:hypothetical protein